jgi:tRNA dimethylallyltransferase
MWGTLLPNYFLITDLATKIIYVIAGPTAVGKTAIAIALAKRLGTSIVSADSRQCYKEMTIGTAKPSKEELAEVKHYFIDVFPVTESLSAADYERLALGYLEEIFTTSNTAVVCGGTGLYIKALTDGIDEMPQVNEDIVEEVNNGYNEHGIEWLKEAIRNEDPWFYQAGEMDNPVRLIRALVFRRSTGESILSYRRGEKKERDFTTIKIGLELPREVLYDRINKRVNIMIEEGLQDEVKALYPQRQLKNLQTVGYSELFDYLDNKCSLAEAVDKIKQHSRNYAKRQMTWFKKDEEMQWLNAHDENIIDKILAIK